MCCYWTRSLLKLLLLLMLTGRLKLQRKQLLDAAIYLESLALLGKALGFQTHPQGLPRHRWERSSLQQAAVVSRTVT